MKIKTITSTEMNASQRSLIESEKKTHELTFKLCNVYKKCCWLCDFNQKNLMADGFKKIRDVIIKVMDNFVCFKLKLELR